ncbi:MAG TPA: hypothetical protein O0X32_01920 [Methanocorpusculum sp.]|nr:hypothetical protein [Methanocorpusculum sp.]
MKVILPDGTEIQAEPRTVDEILEWLGYNPYEVLAVRDDELLLGDEFCSEEDTLKLISIVHGG